MLMKPLGGEPVVASARMTQIIGYREPHKAIDNLCATYGFHRHQVARNPDGTVQHAYLTLGGATIMLVPAQNDIGGGLTFVQPDAIGGAETQACYCTVFDVEQHYERARRLGAEIVWPLQAMVYGGVGYAARDPEGHLWSFGDYDPRGVAPLEARTRQSVSVSDHVSDDDAARDATSGGETPADDRRWKLNAFGILGASLMALIAFTLHAGLWKPVGDPANVGAAAILSGASATAAAEKKSLLRLRESVARERALKDAAVAKVANLEVKLQATSLANAEAKQAAAQSADSLRQRAQGLEGSLVAAERTASEARSALDAERIAKETAERTAQELKLRLSSATEVQVKAEAEVNDLRAQLDRLEKSLAESDASSKLALAELEVLRQAKAAAQSETSSVQQVLSGELEVKKEADGQLDRAISDLRRQLDAEKKARETAEASAAQLRARIKSAELDKVEAAREVARVKSTPRLRKSNAAGQQRSARSRAKSKKATEGETAAAPMGGTPKNPGWANSTLQEFSPAPAPVIPKGGKQTGAEFWE
ncbi:MAG: VOC family protein [Hyphomicrobium sp.]